MTVNQLSRHIADFDPADWNVIGYFYDGGSDEWAKIYAPEERALEAALVERGIDAERFVTVGAPVPAGWYDGRYADVAKRTCDHCGARFNHGAVAIALDGLAWHIGQVCAGTYFGVTDKRTLAQNKLAKAYATAMERKRIAEEKVAFLAERPGVGEFFAAYEVEYENGTRHFSDGFVRDVGWKLERYGSISDRQIDAIARAFERDGEKEAERFVRELNATPKVPLPEGKRLLVVGVIKSLKTQDSDYGIQFKMLVEGEGGWRVWLTKPNAIADAEVGDTISFNADIIRSRDDEFFGFGKRPTKAMIVRRA